MLPCRGDGIIRLCTTSTDSPCSGKGSCARAPGTYEVGQHVAAHAKNRTDVSAGLQTFLFTSACRHATQTNLNIGGTKRRPTACKACLGRKGRGARRGGKDGQRRYGEAHASGDRVSVHGSSSSLKKGALWLCLRRASALHISKLEIGNFRFGPSFFWALST